MNISPSQNIGDPLQFPSQQNTHTVNKCMVILSYTLSYMTLVSHFQGESGTRNVCVHIVGVITEHL